MCAWDKGLPIAGRKARYIDDDIRANNAALETAFDNEHDFTTGGTQTGRHPQGSARCFFQDAAPSTRIDGTAFTSADFGSLWIDSNSSPDNQFNILTAIGPVTWTPVSTEIIAFLVAQINTWALAQTFSVSPVFTLGLVANNSYIQGRNNAGNGNVDIAKVNTSDGITLGAVTTLPDTSALATSGAPVADAQLANKKYVDDGLALKSGLMTPSTYAGEESVTYPNGEIVKRGYKAKTGASDTITFAVAFPNGVVAGFLTSQHTASVGWESVITTLNTTTLIISWGAGALTGAYWEAKGW